MAAKKKEVVTLQEVQEPEVKEVQSALGGALKKAREAQMLTIKDVCSRLHLNEKQVTAMEQDDFASLNDPTRARGFIRAYARLLGLDDESLVSRHRQLFPEDSLNPIKVTTETLARAPKREGVPKYLLGIGALILLMLLVWFLSTLNFSILSSEESQVEATQDLPEVALPASERAQEDAAKALVNEIQLPQQQQALAPAAVPADPAKVESSKVDATEPLEPKLAEVAKAPANAASLKFVVTESAWVDVKDSAGKSILSKVLKPGVDEMVQGVPPLKVHVGNAKGTQVFYNGQPVDYSSSTFSNTARVTLGAQ
jgi:cytoskeleton protein RodZ